MSTDSAAEGEPRIDPSFLDDRSLVETRELYETTREICSRLELDEVLQAIVRRVDRVLDGDAAYLATCDDEHRVLRMRSFDNIRSPKFRALAFPYGFGLGGAVAAERRPMMVNNYQFDLDYRVRHHDEIEDAVIDEGLHGGAAAPVEFEGRLLAVLFVAKRIPYQFTQHQLTLLSSLANAAAIAINNAQVHGRLVATMAIHKELMEIALADRGPAAVAQTLAGFIQGPVLLLNWQGRALADESYHDRQVAAPGLAELAGTASQSLQEGSIRVIAIHLGGETEGYLVADLGKADEGLGADAMEQASTVFALELAKLRSAEQAALRLRGGLLSELLSYPDTDEARLLRDSERLGCDLEDQHIAAIVRFRREDNHVGEGTSAPNLVHRLTQSVSRACHAAARRCLVAEHGDAVVVLVPTDDSIAAQRILEYCVDQCRAARLPEVIVGLGSATRRLGDYAESFAEATHAATAARGGRVGTVVRFDQLGFHRIVLGARPASDVAQMARNVLAPLSDYDQRRGGGLVHTVGVFLECNGNAEATARKLNLHPNSLRGRLNRIAELLDRDLADPTTRLDLFLALETCALLPQDI